MMKLFFMVNGIENMFQKKSNPVIKLLRIEIAENNIASFNTAKSLGFEYEGKIVKYKKINGKDRYITEHHFVKKIITQRKEENTLRKGLWKHVIHLTS